MKSSLTNEEVIQKIGRGIDLIIKLKTLEMRRDRSGTEMTLMLHSLGCTPSEISDLLNLPTSTINPILSKARKSKTKR